MKLKIFNFSEYSLRRYNFKIVFLIAALCIMGYLVVTSALSNDPTRDSTLEKQLMGIAIGALFMIVLSVIDYHFVLKAAPLIYIGVVAILALVLFIGVTYYDATRWFRIGTVQFQPSEFAKIGVIVVFAAYFASNKERINKPLVLIIAVALFGVIAFLIYSEPDLSTTIVVTFIFLSLLYVAKISYKWILGVLAVVLPVGGFILYKLVNDVDESGVLRHYQLNRIMAWLHPDQYRTSGLNTQQENSILAISSGQLYGKGLNNTSFESVKNGNFLYEEDCDFIFSVIGEELGFVGSLAVLSLMTFLVLECFKIGFRAKDMGGRLIAVGMGSLLAFQTFVNIAVATGLLPNTGLPLPFMSAGVSSMLSLFIGMGVVLNVGMQRRNPDSDW